MHRQAGRRFPRRPLALRAGGAAIAAVLGIGLVTHGFHDSARAQEPAPGGFEVVAVSGRNAVLLPSAEATAQLRSAAGAILGRSYETGGHRIHELTIEGRRYRAATPLEGPASRIAFDVGRRQFVRLLPGIRVECESRAEAESIARRIGAVRTRYLDRLGIAFLTLPDAVHPAEAAERVNDLAGRDLASVRFYRSRPQWK